MGLLRKLARLPSPDYQQHPFVFATASVAVAIAVRLLLDRWLGDNSPYPVFLIAVAVTALYANARSSLTAAALGAVAANYFFVPPRHSLSLLGTAQVVALCSYAGAALAIALIVRTRNAALRRAESACMQADELRNRLQAIVDAAPTAVVTLGMDRTVTAWNRAAEQIFGWRADEIIGKEMLVPQSAQRQWESIREALVSGQSVVNVETKCLRKDRTEVDVLLSDSPVMGEGGELVAFVVVIVDASELVAARQQLESTLGALKESEERFRVLVQSAAQAVWEADSEGKQVQDSPSWRAYTGQQLEEMLDLGWANAIHPDDRAYAERMWRESVQAGRNFNAEFRVRGPEGGWRWTNVHGAPIRDESGKISKWVGMNLDITEQKQAEDALRSSEKRLAGQKEALELAVNGASLEAVLNCIVRKVREQIDEHARTAIFLVDDDGTHLRFAASAGMAEAYTSAMDGFEIGPGKPACGSVAYTSQPSIVKDVATDPLWAPYLSLAREHRICSCWSFPIRSIGEKPLGTLAVYHSTSREPKSSERESLSLLAQTAAIVIKQHKAMEERRRAEEALRRAEALAATGRMAHAMAHEINNPLEAITNLLYLLQKDSSMAQTSRERVAYAAAELVRVSHITKQTLSLYSGAKGPKPTNVCALLDGVVETFSQLIAAKQISMERRYKWNGKIELLQNEMQEVFWNVLDNAIDAVPMAGRISIRIRMAHERNRNDRTGIRITIADNGRGFSSEHQRKLFEPFVSAKDQKGVGLGLWVVHDIVARHGGTIRIRTTTRPGRNGTCCVVFLPTQPTQANIHAPGKPTAVSTPRVDAASVRAV